MQTIFRNNPNSNFTIFSNAFIGSTIPPVPQKIATYLLSKGKTWRMQRKDLMKQLGLTAHTVQAGLKWLAQNGYAYFTRHCGKTTWFFFESPQLRTATAAPIVTTTVTAPLQNTAPEITAPLPAPPPQPETATAPAIAESAVIQYVEIPHVLESTEKEIKIKTTTPPVSAPIKKEIVVVSDNLIYPVQLTPSEKKQSTEIITKAPAAQQQPVLFALAYMLATGTIKKPCGYLNELVKRANNGTFEAVTATTAPKQGGKPIIPLWQGHKEPPPIDNNSFFADLEKRFGAKATAAIPAKT
jgi:hypothetical protein